jgi:hypothetical protein
MEVLCESRVAVDSECVFMFIIPYCEISTSLADIGFLAVWACQLVYSGRREYVWVLVFIGQVVVYGVIRAVCYFEVWDPSINMKT